MGQTFRVSICQAIPGWTAHVVVAQIPAQGPKTLKVYVQPGV